MAGRSTRPSSARANTNDIPDFTTAWMAGSGAGHDESGNGFRPER
jgi:hypothetical protein